MGERERLLLNVVGEALQAGDEDQACGLELLGEGARNGQSARLYCLKRGGENKENICISNNKYMQNECVTNAFSAYTSQICLPLPDEHSPGLNHQISMTPRSSACCSPSG